MSENNLGTKGTSIRGGIAALDMSFDKNKLLFG